jgi:hypothetical protein
MPDDPATVPCSKTGLGLIRSAGRQFAILAKTLFTKRFPSPP